MNEQPQRERVRLSEIETQALGAELAAAQRQLQLAREERKITVAEIAARMLASQQKIAELTDAIITGYREMAVLRIVTRDSDLARIIRADTNETVRYEPLRPEERQDNLAFGFEEAPDERPEPPDER